MYNEIYHHGILGMKWGVRRTPAQLGRSRKTSKESWSEDAKTASRIKKKNPKQMSNSELRQLNERIRLEQEYSRLNPNTIAKGKKAIAATAAFMSTALTLYNNSDKIINVGKKVVNKFK